MCVVDTDYGCGIITRGSQNLIKIDEELTWDLLNGNRENLLNLVSINKFLKKYNLNYEKN